MSKLWYGNRKQILSKLRNPHAGETAALSQMRYGSGQQVLPQLRSCHKRRGGAFRRICILCGGAFCRIYILRRELFVN